MAIVVAGLELIEARAPVVIRVQLNGRTLYSRAIGIKLHRHAFGALLRLVVIVFPELCHAERSGLRRIDDIHRTGNGIALARLNLLALDRDNPIAIAFHHKVHRIRLLESHGSLCLFELIAAGRKGNHIHGIGHRGEHRLVALHVACRLLIDRAIIRDLVDGELRASQLRSILAMLHEAHLRARRVVRIDDAARRAYEHIILVHVVRVGDIRHLVAHENEAMGRVIKHIVLCRLCLNQAVEGVQLKRINPYPFGVSIRACGDAGLNRGPFLRVLVVGIQTEDRAAQSGRALILLGKPHHRLAFGLARGLQHRHGLAHRVFVACGLVYLVVRGVLHFDILARRAGHLGLVSDLHVGVVWHMYRELVVGAHLGSVNGVSERFTVRRIDDLYRTHINRERLRTRIDNGHGIAVGIKVGLVRVCKNRESGVGHRQAAVLHALIHGDMLHFRCRARLLFVAIAVRQARLVDVAESLRSRAIQVIGIDNLRHNLEFETVKDVPVIRMGLADLIVLETRKLYRQGGRAILVLDSID